MNISYHSLCSGVLSAPQNDAVQQVMNSDAAPSSISSVIIPKTKDKKSHFHVNCYIKGCHCTVKVAAMVDSGATLLFLDQKYADRHKMWQIPLEHPIILYNIDGSLNKASSITHKVKLQLWIGLDYEEHEFLLTSLGLENVILGLPWLCSRNPAIDWQAGTMRLNASGEEITQPQPEIHHILANRMERHQLLCDGIIESMQDEVFCQAGYSLLQDIAIQQTTARPVQTFEDIVPELLCSVLFVHVWLSISVNSLSP